MHIKSITLDGFKSYSQRTEIEDFDNQFNAITGLNGSGKSNILDSICFVLGITNLAQVRAANLQELVYKNGQAGIKKATVSITFDNSDIKNSPYGLEQCPEITITRQIVVGGKNKYFINGVSATNTRVHDLFHSVKLNVNNPHFLIMQGRITKVLNMKPPEILSLLEEAAGTKLFEIRKAQALKTMEKKNMKLADIEKLLRDEIAPNVSKLREQRQNYFRYETVCREIEHLNKFVVAFEYSTCKRLLGENEDAVASKATELSETKSRLAELEQEKLQLKSDFEQTELKKKQMEGDELQQLENVHSECQKTEAVSQSRMKRAKEMLRDIQSSAKSHEHQLAELTRSREEKQEQLNAASGVDFDRIQEECKASSMALEQAEQNLQGVIAGLVRTEDGKAANLTEQLRSSVDQRHSCETELKQLQMRLEHANNESVTKRKECEQAGALQRGQSDEEKRHESLINSVTRLQEQMDRLKADQTELGGPEDQLIQQEREVDSAGRRMDLEIESLRRGMPQMQFEYRDPAPNFDRRRVLGPVARLFDIEDKKFATALQTAAGGKLYNIVVDTDETSSLLLKSGGLQRRVTMLPLNRIRGNRIPDQVLQTAERIVGRGNVHTALSLIRFDRALTPAMEFVFGSCLVCPDLDTARKVAFARGVERRTVTLDGDIFDPQGTLSGGSRNQNGPPILLRLAELREKEARMSEFLCQRDQLRGKRQQANVLDRRLAQVQSELRREKHELQEVEFRLRQTDKHRLRMDYENLVAEIQRMEGEVTAAQTRLKESEERVKRVQARLDNAKEEQERERRQAETTLEKARETQQACEAKLREKEQLRGVLALELESIAKELDTVTQAGRTVLEGVEEARKAVTNAEEEANEAIKACQASKEALQAHKTQVRELTQRIVSIKRSLEQCVTNASVAQSTVTRLTHEIEQEEKAKSTAQKKLRHLLEKYAWIREEEREFGVPEGPYCFRTRDPDEVSRTLSGLLEDKENLERTVDMRAMNALGRSEERHNELVKNRSQVMADKQQLQGVMDDLDKQRNRILTEAYETVNREFDKIFSTLLPNSRAQLRPPENKSVQDGLEFRIALGDVWKESLSELSGGQRSLVALSLILALLQFQPAPLYILDEVDAALDLSHTQNIGLLIKNHFKNSQFIVVSLKDGMFNNANVLFKTKFVDGVSTVTRHTANRPNERR